MLVFTETGPLDRMRVLPEKSSSSTYPGPPVVTSTRFRDDPERVFEFIEHFSGPEPVVQPGRFEYHPFLNRCPPDEDFGRFCSEAKGLQGRVRDSLRRQAPGAQPCFRAFPSLVDLPFPRHERGIVHEVPESQRQKILSLAVVSMDRLRQCFLNTAAAIRVGGEGQLHPVTDPREDLLGHL